MKYMRKNTLQKDGRESEVLILADYGEHNSLFTVFYVFEVSCNAIYYL